MENKENSLENKPGAAEGAETETENEKMYSQEEVDALLQAEADRRVTAALKKAEAKNAQKLREAEKLAKMSATEQYEYQLQQREAAIEEKERELALAENKAEASKILAEKGLDIGLVDFVVAEDAETMNNNIKLLDSSFKKSVKAEIERRLAGATPKKGLPREQTITKADFLKMSYSELMELKTNNPELYKSFTE